jgi:hypothetical protein
MFFEMRQGFTVPRKIATFVSDCSNNESTLSRLAYMSESQLVIGTKSLRTPLTTTWARYLLPFESRAAAYNNNFLLVPV